MYEIISQLPFNGFHVKGTITLPVKTKSLIILSHGFTSSKHVPHEAIFAKKFQEAGFGTVVLNFPEHELQWDEQNIDLLTNGLLTSTNWLHHHSEYRDLNLAYFGTGTGAAVAIKTAIQLNTDIKAIVCLSGRMDLVKKELNQLKAPTMLIAGELDFHTLNINQKSFDRIAAEKHIAIVSGASHLFEEPQKTDEAANIAISWYRKHFKTRRQEMLK